MIFNLTKSINTYSLFDARTTTEKSSLYRISDNNSMVGQFSYSKWECLCSFKEQKLYIKQYRKSFRSLKTEIVDLETDKIIGEYKLNSWAVFRGFRHQLMLDNKIYTLKRRSPDIRYSILKRDTWGHYKFELTNYNEKIVYKFKIKTPSFALGNPRLESPFEGTIEGDASHGLLMTLGCFLIEKELESTAD